jgi:DNA-binding MarR family transcriptional regulator
MTQIAAGTERAKAAEVMAACACYNLRKATRAVTQMYDDALRSTGLRATQFTLLTFLSGLGPVRITDLAKAVGMDYTTLVRNLNLLERDGLAASHSGEDGRVREVSATARGQRALAAAFPLWEKAQARIAKDLGRERLGRLLSDLSATATATATATRAHTT